MVRPRFIAHLADGGAWLLCAWMGWEVWKDLSSTGWFAGILRIIFIFLLPPLLPYWVILRCSVPLVRAARDVERRRELWLTPEGLVLDWQSRVQWHLRRAVLPFSALWLYCAVGGLLAWLREGGGGSDPHLLSALLLSAIGTVLGAALCFFAGARMARRPETPLAGLAAACVGGHTALLAVLYFAADLVFESLIRELYWVFPACLLALVVPMCFQALRRWSALRVAFLGLPEGDDG
ncbi:MAG: hypothetical protein SF028_06390 [Candidatus Sumerlaeia bacterium]|nr:hypothetical protein [Candidatus Sumerlaeia bacterium]